MNEMSTDPPLLDGHTMSAQAAAVAYEAALEDTANAAALEDTANAAALEDTANVAAPSEAAPNGTSQTGEAVTNGTTPAPLHMPEPPPATPSNLTVAQRAPAVSPPAPAAASLRLRMKVWTDPRTRARYLVPVAVFRDVVRGQPISDVMHAYAMRDGDTRRVTLSAAEWNALPFFYFQEDGWSQRVTERPVP